MRPSLLISLFLLLWDGLFPRRRSGKFRTSLRAARFPVGKIPVTLPCPLNTTLKLENGSKVPILIPRLVEQNGIEIFNGLS